MIRITRDEILNLESQLRSGRGREVAEFFRKLKKNEVARRDGVVLANLARRAGAPEIALRILRQWVRPGKRSSSAPLTLQATPQESCEYAACLIRLGARSEGVEILKKLPSDGYPEILMVEAASLFSSWNYAQSIPLLRKVLSMGFDDDYKNLVVKVNLAAALVFENEFNEAGSLLLEILAQARQGNLVLLSGNCLELLAQLYINQGAYEKATESLNAAEGALKLTENLDYFFVQKWKAILDALKERGSDDAIKTLRKVRRDAYLHCHWESVRDCDYYSAMISRNVDLLLEVYFGTPFEAYRQKIASRVDFDFSIPEVFDWPIAGTSSNRIFDLLEGREIQGRGSLKPGDLMHRLVNVLSQDFYRPARAAYLFSQLFPKEYFNTDSSVNRVHQVVRRLRSWLESHIVALTVDEVSGAYRLRADAPILVRKRTEELPVQESEVLLLKVRNLFKEESFSATEAAAKLEKSKRTVLRILQSGIQAGTVEKSGNGRKVLYKMIGIKAA